MNELDQVREMVISRLEKALLEREIEILRSWGNKDCTNMADEAIINDKELASLNELIGQLKTNRRLVIPEAEGICQIDCTAHKHNAHVLGYN